MATPTFNLPTSGSDPKRATKEGLEGNINSIIQYLDNARIVGDDRGTEGFYNAGPWDASTGVFPIVRGQGGAVQNGDTFFVQDGGAGVVDGQPQFEVGQRIIALVDNPSSATYAGNWERTNTISTLEPITSRVDAMSVPFDTVDDYLVASLEDIKTAANATTGTIYVETSDGIGRYIVDLAQTASFNHTTDGGVECTVLPYARGYNVKAFGARGVNFDQDDQPFVLAALTAGVDQGVNVYAPAGEYLLDYDGTQVSLTEITKDFVFEGDGPTTVFKRGDGIVTGSFRKIFNFGSATGASITVRDMTIDGNARTSGIPYPLSGVSGVFQAGETVTKTETKVVGGVSRTYTYEYTVIKVEGSTLFIYETAVSGSPNTFPELKTGDAITGQTSGATATIQTSLGAFVYQQSHSLAFSPTGLFGIERASAIGIHSEDPTADGVSYGGNGTNTIRHIVNERITSGVRNRVRSDITITCSFDTNLVSACVVGKYEHELNGSISEVMRNQTTVNGLQTNIWLDVTHADAGDALAYELPKFNANGLIASGFLQLGGADFTFNGAKFGLDCSPRLFDGRYEFNGGSSYFGINGQDFSPEKGYTFDGNSLPKKVKFVGHEFDCNPASQNAMREFFSGLNNLDADAEVFEFINCSFLAENVRSAFLRSGKYRFQGCTHNFAGDAVSYVGGGVSGTGNEVELYENVVTHTDGLLLKCPTGGDELSIWMRGNSHRHQKSLLELAANAVMSPRGTGSILNFVEVDDYQMASTPTDRHFVAGQQIRFTAPAAGGQIGVQCTTTGKAGTSAVFKSLGNLGA